MVKRIIGAMLVAVLALAFSTASFAQEATKQVKKEEMKAEVRALKSVSCDPTCGFMVRSHDDKELTDIVKTHAKKAHNMDMTDEEILGVAKTEHAPDVKETEKKDVKK